MSKCRRLFSNDWRKRGGGADITTKSYALGIRENLGAFAQQLLQVFFVGLTIGLQRTVIPALAETEFGVVHGSMTAVFAFIISFGLVKGIMNFVSGRVSERVGRRRVLIWGWLAALPIPLMILYAPSWSWIIAANILLGVNQGFCWSMTVTAKLDIVRANQRGLATGFNEFAGYGGVALAGTGFFLCSVGVLIFPYLASITSWSIVAAIVGVGMALLYPTLIAAMGDIAHPLWRGSALGVYRFWRDLGYAIGALAMGLIADTVGLLEAGFWFTGIAMACSGLWLLLAMEETHPGLNPEPEKLKASDA
jgi:MFS family permease